MARIRHVLAGTGWEGICQALMACATMYVSPPPPAAPPGPDGPLRGHPERLCPELPPSAAESALWAGLSADPRFRPRA